MSHDRGCFKCYDDPPYYNCKDPNCPMLNMGYYSREAVIERRDAYLIKKQAEEDQRRAQALKFWAV